jgi:hypothetical protein
MDLKCLFDFIYVLHASALPHSVKNHFPLISTVVLELSGLLRKVSLIRPSESFSGSCHGSTPTPVMTITIPWPFHGSAFPASTTGTVQPTKKSSTVSLRHYATPGVSPPSARVDPRLKSQERRPVRLWDLWKYGVVVASKGGFQVVCCEGSKKPFFSLLRVYLF